MHSKSVMPMVDIEKRNHEIKLQNHLILSGQFPTCTQCEAWDNDTETCKQYNMRPPAKVIVTGCVTFEHEIPF